MNDVKHFYIGFTGTRKGITPSQEIALFKLLQQIYREALPLFSTNKLRCIGIHGDCIGADTTFHKLCLMLSFNIILYPSIYTSLRAFCQNANIAYAPKPPLERNKDIVKKCDVLIACPESFDEKLRSGTWSTVRYQRKEKKEIYIIFPDGNLSHETS